MFNEIVDNDIHHCGELNYLTAGDSPACPSNVIGHNWIHEVSHHAPTPQQRESRNIIEYNLIQRTACGTGDTGAIMLGRRPAPTAARQGHIIRYNRDRRAARTSAFILTITIATASSTATSLSALPIFYLHPWRQE